MKLLSKMTLEELQDERMKVFQQRVEAIHNGDKDHWCKLVDYSEAIATEIDQRLIKKANASNDASASKIAEPVKREVSKHFKNLGREAGNDPMNY